MSPNQFFSVVVSLNQSIFHREFVNFNFPMREPFYIYVCDFLTFSSICLKLFSNSSSHEGSAIRLQTGVQKPANILNARSTARMVRENYLPRYLKVE